MALLSQQEDADGAATDVIGIYDVKSWTCKFMFNVELKDIQDISFVRDESQILVWQTVSGGGQAHCYRISNDQVILAAEINLGERVAINYAVLSQTAMMQTLAIAPTSSNLHIYNTLSWQE
jgi:hypothetical protein